MYMYIHMPNWDTVIFSHWSFKIPRSFQKYYSRDYEKLQG